jgi:hypothetical protein
MWKLLQLIRREAPLAQTESEARPAAVEIESIRTRCKPALNFITRPDGAA